MQSDITPMNVTALRASGIFQEMFKSVCQQKSRVLEGPGRAVSLTPRITNHSVVAEGQSVRSTDLEILWSIVGRVRAAESVELGN